MPVEQTVDKLTTWAFLQEPAIVIALLFIAALLGILWVIFQKLLTGIESLATAINNLNASNNLNAELTKERLETLKSNSEKNDNWINGVIKELINAVTSLINEHGKQTAKLDVVINQSGTFIDETRESRLKAREAYGTIKGNVDAIAKKVDDMPSKFDELKSTLEKIK